MCQHSNGSHHSYISAIFPTIEQYAATNGLITKLHCDATDSFISLIFPDHAIEKVVNITPTSAGFAVEIFTCQNLANHNPKWCWQQIGQARYHGQGIPLLTMLLEQACQILADISERKLEHSFNKMQRYVEQSIQPLLAQFAAEQVGELEKIAWDSFTIRWPANCPAHSLNIEVSPKSGIIIQAEQAALESEEGTESLWSLRLADWSDTDTFLRLLKFAAMRFNSTPERAREQLRSPILWQAYQIVHDFAAAHDLSIEVATATGEMLRISWQVESLQKEIRISSAESQTANIRLEISQVVEQTEPTAEQLRKLYQEQVVELADERAKFTDELMGLLEQVWQTAAEIGPQELEHTYQEQSQYLERQLDPLLRRFANRYDGELLAEAGLNREIVWPQPSPRFSLTITLDQANGVRLAGSHRTYLGPSSGEVMEQCQKLADLQLPDWQDSTALLGLLEEARRRLENCSGLGF